MGDTQGLIALDIDGTLTAQDHLIPNEVIEHLYHLNKNGWQIALITGRPYSFARRSLENFNFPFLLAIQNGADLLEMPAKKLFQRTYLPADILKGLDANCLIYSGFDSGDFCYLCPDRFPQEMQNYLKKLETLSDAPWKCTETFDFEDEQFPLIKYIGSKKDIEQLCQKLKSNTSISATMVTDPVSEGLYHLLLLTHAQATKGKALRRIADSLNITYPIIAAGDDGNDVPMLEEADIAIVMENAPQYVLDHGDIIAKPSTELGIIDALNRAIKNAIL